MLNDDKVYQEWRRAGDVMASNLQRALMAMKLSEVERLTAALQRHKRFDPREGVPVAETAEYMRRMSNP